jgi:RNA polymerase sigma-70 factor (ECF subfamily)
MTPDARHRADLGADLVARTSYGRLLSILVAGSRDIAAAEDALASAFEAALRTWPDRGVPQNPEAWLLTAARNAIHNDRRHRGVQASAIPDLLRRHEGLGESDSFPDDRLRLLFLCAHPAIDEGIRTPLMLQTVLGLDADRIARAFVVAPATMAQRLVRAKAKIRDAGLRFVLTEAELSSDRLQDVLDAVYAAFGTGWDSADAEGLVEEAIYLARLIASLMPNQPEPQGLLALMLYCHARRAARRDTDGRFVPLDRQDARLWNRDMIIEAEGLLTAASRHGRFGRYLCEAAIQSVHVQRPLTGATNHAALALLYGLLHQHAPSLGAAVSLAAVLVETGDLIRARAVLDALPDARHQQYQPYWVTLGRLAQADGDADLAREALTRALALTADDAAREHLLRQSHRPA